MAKDINCVLFNKNSLINEFLLAFIIVSLIKSTIFA